MEKEFVPYKLALRMKQLGFNEPCLAFYGDENDFSMDSSRKNNPFRKTECTAPLYQQAFRWFREKYQIFPEVLTDCTTEPKFVYTYNTFYGNPKDLTEQEWGWENNIGQYSELYRSYEEAELTCLTKLIEIVEQKEK
jgi:hypothetical protein